MSQIDVLSFFLLSQNIRALVGYSFQSRLYRDWIILQNRFTNLRGADDKKLKLRVCQGAKATA